MPHFRVKIGKMHHFCLNLEILGGSLGLLAPPSYAGAALLHSVLAWGFMETTIDE